MNTIRTISIIAVFAVATSIGTAQDYPDEYLGLPGDNLNLYAVMSLFQESETLEKFERSLNDQETTINNLDLNGDELIDYISVSDYVDQEVHSIVLRASLNQNEQQDIAVFVVDKLRNGEVQIQLIGDEALYGPNYIVEPIYAETPNPGYTGNISRSNVNVVTTSYYDIAAWPVVRYMYRPGYVVWRSSWYWGYYPSYWHSWQPYYYHYYYGYHSHRHDYYYGHYRHWNHHRSRSYNTFYHSHVRVHSPTVVVNINNGRYKKTYSRPDQRSVGESQSTRTASSRTNTSRTVVPKERSDSRTKVVSGREGVQRTTPTRTSTTRTSQSRSSKPTVQSSSRERKPAVQRSPKSSSSSSVSRSSSSRSKPSVSRSSSSRSKPAVSKSSSSRSKPSVSKSSSSSRSSKGSKKSSKKSSSSSRR